jgi:hypothetical protein
MPRKLLVKNNYKRGAAKERKIVNEARQAGHIAFRSAGSHSPIDLVIIKKGQIEGENIIEFVQCKPESMSGKAKDRLAASLAWINGVAITSFDVK